MAADAPDRAGLHAEAGDHGPRRIPLPVGPVVSVRRGVGLAPGPVSEPPRRPAPMTRRREQPLAPQRLAATGTGPLRGLSPSRARLSLLVLLGLMLVTLAAYQPAWNGGVLWDDEGHLTRSDLAMVSGLGR